MTGPRLLFPLIAALLVLALVPPDARAARQPVALFPPETADGGGAGTGPEGLSGPLADSIREGLQDRFDVRAARGEGGNEGLATRVRRARALGAAYMVTGSVARLGRTVTLDLTIAPVEDPGNGRTVVATAADRELPGEAASAAATDNSSPAGARLPAVYRRLVVEGTAKLKLSFFGDEVVGEGETRRRIPRPAGALARSRNLPGDVVSIAWADTDRNGRSDLVAASAEAVAVYGVEGDELILKATVGPAAPGLVHVDAADVNRNGIAEIVAVRYRPGKVASEVWEHDGKEYRRIAADIPHFLRCVDLVDEGIVLVAQEADPDSVFRGPVFRVPRGGYGAGAAPAEARPLPLPPGTAIYSFVPLRHGKEQRFAVLGEDGRLALLDAEGTELSIALDALTGTETVLEAAAAGIRGRERPDASGGRPSSPGDGRRRLPGRLFAVDLDGDRTDEVVVPNNLLAAGTFFDNIRVFADAEILAFAQDGIRLRLAWRSPLVGGAARDAFVDAAGKGKPFRIGIAAHDRGKILGRFGEWRLLWLK